MWSKKSLPLLGTASTLLNMGHFSSLPGIPASCERPHTKCLHLNHCRTPRVRQKCCSLSCLVAGAARFTPGPSYSTKQGSHNLNLARREDLRVTLYHIRSNSQSITMSMSTHGDAVPFPAEAQHIDLGYTAPIAYSALQHWARHVIRASHPRELQTDKL